jgi:glycosyltransferase involved in cell wall biosynthesis
MISSDAYPRVLVINALPFNFEMGNGITQSNLFKGWPKDRLACLYWNNGVVLNSSICAQHIQADTIWSWSSRSARRCGAYRVLRKTGTSDNAAVGVTANHVESARSVIWRIVDLFSRTEWARKARLGRTALDAVERFRPQLLYVVLDPPSMHVAEKVAIVTGAPLALHIFDDWITVARIGINGVGRLHKYEVESRFLSILKHAKLRMAIGEAMRKEYEQRYGLKFLAFQNCLEPEVWLSHGRNDWSSSEPFVFKFAGTIYSPCNLDALILFAQAIGAVIEKGFSSILELHVPRGQLAACTRRFSRFHHVKIFPSPLETESMAELFGSADALIIAVNDDDYGRAHLGLSIPTKLPAYLLSGTPIIAFAPEDCAVSRFLLEHGCGLNLTSGRRTDEVALEISHIVQDTSLRQCLGIAQREVALREFDSDTVRTRFRGALQEVAAGSHK